MTRTRSRSLFHFVLGAEVGLAVASLALVAGCQTSPRIPGARVQVMPEGRLAAVNPADIAIAPVEVLTPGVTVPDTLLRRAAETFLPRKRYSPLKLENVDGALVGVEPASYRAGTLREDAVLELVVHGWDDSLWNLRRTLVVDIEARLVDPQGTDHLPLWSGRMSQRFDLTSEHVDPSTDAGLMELACDRILEELLAKLPARDVQPGGRTALN